jgi:hypothetical protein
MKVHRKITGACGLAIASGAAVAALGSVSVTPAGANPPLSGAVSAGTLTITGSERDDLVSIGLAAASPQTLVVDFGGDGTAELQFDRDTFTRIEVLLRNGDDQFVVNRAGGAFNDEAITVNGGNGDDRFDGGDGDEGFLGGPGDDTIDGNRGADTAVMGSGNDTFRWDPGDGSDVIDGSAGFDAMLFFGSNVAETMSLSADGERAVFLRNVGQIRMDMDRVERLDLRALSGADQITIDDMTGTDVRVADVDLASTAGGPDADADTIVVNGTASDDRVGVAVQDGRVHVDGLPTSTRLSASDTKDTLQIKTLDGNDDVAVRDDVTARVGVVVDLGQGEI